MICAHVCADALMGAVGGEDPYNGRSGPGCSHMPQASSQPLIATV